MAGAWRYAAPRAHHKPGEAVVADIEIVGVIDINTGRFNLIGGPLRVGAIKIQNRMLAIPAVVINVYKVVARNRVQKRPDTFTNRLINRATRCGHQRHD